VLFMLPDQPFTFGQSSRSFSSGRCNSWPSRGGDRRGL